MADTQPVALTIKAQYQGWQVDVAFSGHPSQLERVVAKLEAAGLTPASAEGGTHPPRQKTPRVEPAYSDQGEAMCPKHRKVLKQGQYGLYCSAKDETGPRGYCGLKFQE